MTALGLTSAEARERLEASPPRPPPRGSRSYRDIVWSNTFTVFNLILGTLLVLVLVFGDPRDALFGGVIVANTAIGIFQEVRAKRTLDRLSLLAAPKARAWRDGEIAELPVDQVVVGDAVHLEPGDQVVADGRVIAARALSIDESILTGESDQVAKAEGDEVLSGAYCAAGAGDYEVESVGRRQLRRAHRLRGPRHPQRPEPPPARHQHGAQDHRRRDGPAGDRAGDRARHPGPRGHGLDRHGRRRPGAARARGAGAADQPDVRGRRREARAAGDARAAAERRREPGQRRHGLLRQDRDAHGQPHPAGGRRARARATTRTRLRALLGALAASAGARNSTSQAIAEGIPAEARPVAAEVPFSSARKWSAVQIDGAGTLVLGAPDILARAGVPVPGPLRESIERHARERRRVVLLARTAAPLSGEDLPGGLAPVGIALLVEGLRQEAVGAVAFLASQGVDLKVISGDGVDTVQAVALAAGVPGAEASLAGPDIPEEDGALADAAMRTTVFGRVTPEQKRRLIRGLTERGRYVAMCGDGVNDVLALKEARLAIAMGNGSQMAKGVSDLVLLTNQFATVPAAVEEGRRIIRNTHRVAKLFVAKSVYSAALLATFGLAPIAFPFLPRHLSVTSSLTIGIPAFFLALAKSSGPVRREGFLRSLAAFVRARRPHRRDGDRGRLPDRARAARPVGDPGAQRRRGGGDGRRPRDRDRGRARRRAAAGEALGLGHGRRLRAGLHAGSAGGGAARLLRRGGPDLGRLVGHRRLLGRRHRPARRRPPDPVARAHGGRARRAGQRGGARRATATIPRMPSNPYGPSDPAKRHSAAMTDGPDRAPARAMLKGVGFTDEDLARPLVGVATTWIETMPCNLNQRELAVHVKEGIREAGGMPVELNTISVSDGVSMGTEGMRCSLVSREVIADSIELAARGHMFDGLVCLVGCDKTIPAAVMALARLDIPGLVLYNGSIAPGRFDGRDVTIQDVFEVVGAHAAGRVGPEQVHALESVACPGAGACGGQFTANTMSMALDLLGISPAGPQRRARDAPRQGGGRPRGRPPGRCAWCARTCAPRRSSPATSIDNAIAGVAASGGSTNGVLHLLAIAWELGIPLTIDDFDTIAERTPIVAEPHAGRPLRRHRPPRGRRRGGDDARAGQGRAGPPGGRATSTAARWARSPPARARRPARRSSSRSRRPCRRPGAWRSCAATSPPRARW